MKKREFQKKATAALLKKLAEVCEELRQNPNITVASKFHNSYFKLREDYNLIQVTVKQTGEISYQLTDLIGITDRKQIYYEYCDYDDHACIIEKFSGDFARLYKDLLLAGTLHDFCGIRLSFDTDAGRQLEEYEAYISAGRMPAE